MSINNRSSKYIPFIISISLIVGLLIGSFISNRFSGNRLSIINAPTGNKINAVLQYINEEYVDTVDFENLIESSIPQILSKLDPHSSYVSAKNVEAEMQDLKGRFSGIGVVFTILDDTARIIRVIKEGPSEEVGLKAGDKIVSVDGKNFVGKMLTNDYAMSHLKGPKASKVNLGIMRKGANKVMKFTIERGDVPVNTVTAAYMIDKSTGYVQVSAFGETTYGEFLKALAELNHEGFKQLIVDLRGNHGGYMEPATRMANEFLPKDRLIVYTQGRKSARQEYTSDGRGSYQNIPLIVLVDETSASASEIFAAAIQDNDRGTIIGRRSFGKGLVQAPIEFSDHSIMRLTIARYYSASGRCLQKPYTQGDSENYQNDLLTRMEKGEYFSQDSIKLKGKKFKTRLGRIVYSEGGVMPDYFVPEDTLGMNSYYYKLVRDGWMSKYAFIYVDANREKFGKMKDGSELVNYLKKQDLPHKVAEYAAKNGVKYRYNAVKEAYKIIQEGIIALILDDFYDTAERLKFINESDANIKKALEVFKEGKAFPNAPEKEKKSDKKTARLSPHNNTKICRNKLVIS